MLSSSSSLARYRTALLPLALCAATGVGCAGDPSGADSSAQPGADAAGATRTAKVRLEQDSAAREVTFVDRNGMAIAEGDIVLGATALLVSNEKSIGHSDIGRRWPDGVIPYGFASNIRGTLKANIEAAMAHWEARTNIRFVLRSSKNQAVYPNYCRFVVTSPASNDGASDVGMVGGIQQLELGGGATTDVIIHEIGHLVGLWHEQSREDRNDHVSYNPDNVADADRRHNFDQQINDGIDIGDYDFESMMHYDLALFGKPNLDPLTPVSAVPAGVNVGNATELSDGDIAGVLQLYPNKMLGQRIDFDADGKQDILWTTRGAGASIWYMDGARARSSNTIQESGVNGWFVAGTGDFDGDGYAELLWTNADGGFAIWNTKDGVIQPEPAITQRSNGYRFVGVNDFNGDGTDDLLMMNQIGAVTVITLGQVDAAELQPHYVNDWRLAGTGDVDGDGKGDIIWTRANGGTAVWYMDSVRIRDTSVIEEGEVGWWIAGIADIDGDNRDDFLWTNARGGVAIWLNDGGNIVMNRVLQERGTRGWQVAGLRDFDGNGAADILWSTHEGGIAVWQMPGGSTEPSAYATIQESGSPGWQVVD